jgi:integrase/recombinase XerD
MLVRQFSKDTMNNYARGLKHLVAFLDIYGVVRLTEVTPDVLEEYRTALFYRKTEQGKSLTVGTQVAWLMSAKSFFRFLVHDGYLLSDPARRLELPRRGKNLPNVLSEQEVKLLIETPNIQTAFGLRDRTILELLYGSGIRNQELCNLQLDHLDRCRKLVRIVRGKGNKSRVVPIGDEAQVWLNAYLIRVRPQLLRKADVPFVFLDRWGQNGLGREGLSGIVRKLGRQAGLSKPVTPHALRHSCATHMLRHGAGLRQLQKLLGHASPVTTEHYTQVEISDLKRVISRCHPRERKNRA